VAKLRNGIGLVLIAACLWMPGAAARTIQVEVAAVDEAHIAKASARHLAGSGDRHAPELAYPAKPEPKTDPPLRLSILPLHELAREIPELSVAQLPFFYADLSALHRALDGELGKALRAAARARGWELLAFWDEGVQVMSGNLAYTRAQAIRGMEFALLRDDPIAEIELRALDVWSRRARPTSLAQLHKECVVNSRSATLQQIRSEQLARVHLDLTLTRHRYEGWVVAMRSEAWNALEPDERAGLIERLDSMRAWQREQAARAEANALRDLVKAGMTAHPLPQETWTTYRAMQPAWEDFLPTALPRESRLGLISVAATAAGVDPDRGRREAQPDPQPQPPQRQQRDRNPSAKAEPAGAGGTQAPAALE
jgi:TRAP-type C4-dicarboxylate transport system substrate-binding protein